MPVSKTNRPLTIIVFSGMPLTGKTTLAKKLAKELNLKLIDVDQIRNKIDKTRQDSSEITMLSPKEEFSIMKKAYCLMCRRAWRLVCQNCSVVIVGTFSKPEFKAPLKKLFGLLANKKVLLKTFLLTANDEEIKTRIALRQEAGDLSNIDSMEKFKWAKSFFEAINFTDIVKIDTSKSIATLLKQIKKELS